MEKYYALVSSSDSFRRDTDFVVSFASEKARDAFVDFYKKNDSLDVSACSYDLADRRGYVTCGMAAEMLLIGSSKFAPFTVHATCPDYAR